MSPHLQMIDESNSNCPFCGVALPPSVLAETPVVCPNCTTRVDSSALDHSESDRAESDETMSLATGSGTDDRVTRPISGRRPAKVPERIGRFEVSEVLGSGGFGNVYRAHDPLLDREVAIKVPRFSDDERREELFLHEAKAAAKLRHPNIVAVFECGVVDGQPFIASEFVDGTPLSKMLKAGPIPTRQAVEIAQKISEAIQYAHSEGIIHRDLKPDNIMMNRSSRPQVMDFGLARLVSDAEKSLMSEGSIVGTPAYMSPEQARGDKRAVGPNSDQYSVGVMLYLMLCGSLPYQGESWSIISSVASPKVVPKSPRAHRAEIPRDLEACCLKAMEKDPLDRYENLAAMADDLNRWLEGRTLAARPIGPGEQFFRWCGRNRGVAGLMGVITALILTALVVGYVLAFKFSNLASYATNRANAEQQAKVEVEQLLIDTYTESGLDAGRSGRHQEAVLWFGNAVARSADHPRRERMNRARFHSWLRQTPTPVRIFRGMGHWHKSLIVHPSGQYVMTEQSSPSGGRCRIWAMTSGKLWALPWKPEDITAAAWNGSGDVLALASGTDVRTYRFPEGTLLDSWQHTDHVHLLKFANDADKLALVGHTTVTVRHINEDVTDKVISTPANTLRVCWNPTDETLATLCADQQVYVWNCAPEAEDIPLIPALTCPFQADPPKLWFVAEQLLVVPESDEAVRCWDVSSGQTVWSVPCGNDAQCVVSPDRSRIAILNKGIVTQVSAADGEPVGPTINHPNLVYDASYDSTGKHLLTGCGDHFARIFSASTGELVASLRHGDMVHRVAWFPDGGAWVTVHWKGDLVRVWKPGVGLASGFSKPLDAPAMHVKWNGDGSKFLPCGVDIWRALGAPQILKTADGTPVGSPVSFDGRASDGCFLPRTQNVVFGGSDGPDQAESDRLRDQDLSRPGLIVAANIETGTPVFPPLRTASNVVAVEPSPDGRILAALCHDRSLLMIDPNDGSILHRHETFPGNRFFYGFMIFRRLAFSPSGDRFAVWGSQSTTVEIRNAADGSLLFTVSHNDGSTADFIHNVIFSPDGKTLATCSSDQTVRLFNAENGQNQATPLLHSGWVFSAEFSQDGNRLLTSCQDRQARLWDLQDVSKPLLVTPAQSDEVYTTCFLPGEEFFLIGLRNGDVSVWDAQQGKMLLPGTIDPNQPVIYTLELSPDQSRVIIVGRAPFISGFHPSRWQPSVQQEISRDDLRTLGETIASQELYDGVLMGLSNEAVIDNWEQLFKRHGDHEIFRWTLSSDAAIDH